MLIIALLAEFCHIEMIPDISKPLSNLRIVPALHPKRALLFKLVGITAAWVSSGCFTDA